MNTQTETKSHLVTLHAQPYDIEARGFYFHSLEDYEAKYARNKNSWGGTVEEYEFQFIDGEGNQELLDKLPLKEFFEIVETWDSEDIEKIELLSEAVGAHYIGSTADEIKEKFDDLLIYTSTHNKDDLGAEVMENSDSEAYKAIKPYAHYFDFERWLNDNRDGTYFYKNGVHYYLEYIG